MKQNFLLLEESSQRSKKTAWPKVETISAAMEMILHEPHRSHDFLPMEIPSSAGKAVQ